MRRVSRFEYGWRVVWVAQWLCIAQSIVGILTLGYYVPSWDINWLFWAAKRWFR